MNRKAQAQIITTVLIILLVLAAIVIVWQAVRGTVTESTDVLAGKTACLSVELKLNNLDCDNLAWTLGGSVSRGSDNKKLKVARVVVGPTSWDSATFDPLGSVSLPTAGTLLATGLTADGSVTVQVAPVLIVDGVDVVCDPTDTQTIVCDDGVV